jgi:hypothetical protein
MGDSVFPGAPLAVERQGINAVASAISLHGHIWRETPSADVGIDGQIEFVDIDGGATGRLIAVQVKSGASYFHDGGDAWSYKIDAKHRFYWERFPLPVLLCLFQPSSGDVFWHDIRQFLRGPEASKEAVVRIPKNQTLAKASMPELFRGVGVSGRPFLSREELLGYLVGTRNLNPFFPVSYFDLFVFGLTNICRSLYFNMEVATEVADFRLGSSNSERGIGIGPEDHEFLFDYVAFLVEQHVADVDMSDCMIDWYDRQMQPRFLAPLTSRGRYLVEEIGTLQDDFTERGLMKLDQSTRVVQEGVVQMLFLKSQYDRMPIVERFQSVFEAIRRRG